MDIEYAKTVNGLGIKVMEKINKLMDLSSEADMPLTQERIVNQFVNMKNGHGEENAIVALNNTIKSFKQKANEVQRVKWNKVKNEIFHTTGCVPTSINVLKSEIKSGYIDATGLPSEGWIRKELGIYKSV